MQRRIKIAFLSALMILAAIAMAENAPVTLEDDIGISVGGVWYPVLNDFAPLMEALGEPVETIAAPSCVFKGEDKEFVYEGMSVYTNPLGEIDVWYEAYITGGDFETSRGIGIGASADDVINAYGENYYCESEDKMTYSLTGDPDDYSSPCIIFTLSDDTVTCIDIYYPTNTL